MAKKTKNFAVIFMIIFITGLFIGLVNFSRAQISHAVDGNNGGSINPLIDPFSDYDFNETNSLESCYPAFFDEVILVNDYIESGSLKDTYISDDTYIVVYDESLPVLHVGAEYVYNDTGFTIIVEFHSSDSSSEYEIQVMNWQEGSGDLVDSGIIGTTDTEISVHVSNPDYKYTSEGLDITIDCVGSRLYIDLLKVEYDSFSGYAEDFSDVGEWSVRSPSTGTTTYSTDGDITTIKFEHDSDYLNGIYAEVSIDTNDYPFVEVYVADFQIGGGATDETSWRVRFYDGSTVYNGPDETGTGVFRYNLKELTGGATIIHVYIVINLITSGSGWGQVK
ncbi:MAG: hypothetical protein ACTSPL_04300, partial [Candidatus Odinarchaeia archaeon]